MFCEKEIKKEAIPALGYKDITDWVAQAYEKVKRQYESIKKDRPQIPTTTDDQGDYKRKSLTTTQSITQHNLTSQLFKNLFE